MSDMITEYNQIYAELCDLIGKDNMYIIYQHFKGMQVSFPSKLYSKEYVVSQIAERYDGNNAKQLARDFGYTVKYFNELIKEIDTINKKNKGE